MKQLCVFCGSSEGTNPAVREAVVDLGAEMGARRLGLVYGGSSRGLMGLLADELLGYGVDVVGVIPSFMSDREVAHEGITDLRVVDSMHKRKALMTELADGFLTLPGGFGTLDELFEVLTWRQLGIHGKPCGLLNVAGYFDGLLKQLDAAVREGLLQERHRALLCVSDNPGELVDMLIDRAGDKVERWDQKLV